jgi:cell division transport system ATP-binding protein
MISVSDDKPIVELVKVTKVYRPDVTALNDVSLKVNRGEILFLTGRSGAGKTTLLKLICSLEAPTHGLVEIAGRDLSRLSPSAIQQMRQKIGVAYQEFRLLLNQTVMQNIAMAMEVTYQGRIAIRRRVRELLNLLGIPDKMHKLVCELSRGEQQRVALARAAANSPPLLLVDEPTGNLDSTAAKMVVNLFHNLHEAGSTIIVATHDESIYRNTEHRVVMLKSGEIIPHAGMTPQPLPFTESMSTTRR